MACKNDGQNLAVSLLLVIASVAAVVAFLYLVVPGRTGVNEVVTEEPAEGVRWHVTQRQRVEGIKVRVLADLEYGREYLIVDWGEGTGVTPLLPPADSLSTDSADQVKVSVVPKADPDE